MFKNKKHETYEKTSAQRTPVMMDAHAACGVARGGGCSSMVVSGDLRDQLKPSALGSTAGSGLHCALRIAAGRGAPQVTTQGVDGRLGGDDTGWVVTIPIGQRSNRAHSGCATAAQRAVATARLRVQSPPKVTRWMATWASAWVATGWVGGDEARSGNTGGPAAVGLAHLRRPDGDAIGCSNSTVCTVTAPLVIQSLW